MPTTPPESGCSSPFLAPAQIVSPSTPSATLPSPEQSLLLDCPTPERVRPNGALTPSLITAGRTSPPLKLLNKRKLRGRRRGSYADPLPGGVVNFARFETEKVDELIEFLKELISESAKANRVSLAKMKSMVKVMATGGGAHRFYDQLVKELGVEVRREEEMECLILGLGFVARVPEEVFWFSEELVYAVSHPEGPRTIPANELPRPSPTPPAYQVTFAAPGEDQPVFPCLVVNIGSGVSIVKVDEDGSYERVSGTSLGGGTLWGLLSMLTDASTFDEMLLLSEQGDNSAVDMLVGDIYGSDYNKIGLKSSTIASSFGKVFKHGERQKRSFKQEDIARSLLYAISNNIGHIAYMNAAKYGLDRVFFSGCFIRGHAATISTLSYAIRFWSKGTMRACFLRHEGFLGSIGAWIKNVEETNSEHGESGSEKSECEAGTSPTGARPTGVGGTSPVSSARSTPRPEDGLRGGQTPQASTPAATSGAPTPKPVLTPQGSQNPLSTAPLGGPRSCTPSGAWANGPPRTPPRTASR